MKLFNKQTSLLKTVASSAIISTISLASCGGSSFNIEYADNLNCKDNTLNNYTSLENIQNAIKQKINVETQQKDVSLVDLNYLLSNNNQFIQNIYYEFVAFHSITAPNEFTLTDWVCQSTDTPNFKRWSFIYNGVSYPDITFIYSSDAEGKIKVTTTTGTDFNFPSYTYQNCLVDNNN